MEWTPERIQQVMEGAKGILRQGETIEERIADGAFDRAAETLIDRDRPGEYRSPENLTVMEALQAQTSALLGIGQMLQAILNQLRKK